MELRVGARVQATRAGAHFGRVTLGVGPTLNLELHPNQARQAAEALLRWAAFAEAAEVEVNRGSDLGEMIMIECEGQA